MEQYKCEYFKIKELVHPEFLSDYSEDVLWELFDANLLEAIDRIRDIVGEPITCNTGSLINCGLRHYDDPHYPALDPHKLGRAIDLHFPWIDNTEDTKEQKIKGYDTFRDGYFAIITSVSFEYGISWLHVDTYNRKNRKFTDKRGGR
jgi:hypothetical protein